ncbi:hypothetical protein JRQ81_016097 [Phrynocephalus forsythii]|uniref:Uncharacterized protein n=1 Tax=Phrynocephalus forsythii TaxID=171643 RepID=A0A9Q0XV72_9SAUR|nr:hypothetical protein JRQ81_016097 [Phrynocephalus forsythii]
MAETLHQGPIYFFDQPKTKRKCEKKLEPESLPNLISGSTDPHESGSFHRKPGHTKEQMEGNGVLVNDSSAKQVLGPPQTYGPFIVQPASEKVHSQTSQIPSHGPTEVLLPPSLDQYQSIAVAILQELEDMLNHFSKEKIIVPLGTLNILNYSWKHLIEGAWYNKKSCQELVYKNVNSSRRQSSEMSNTLSSTSELTDCERTEDLTRKSKKTVDFPSGPAKGSENPGTVLNKTISFSLSSEACKEKGWISQHSDCDPKCLEWKVP